MTVFTHAAVGLGLGSIQPEHRWAMLAFSLLPDLDHLLRIGTWRLKLGSLFESRSVMHELLGALVWACVGTAVSVFDHQMGSAFLLCVSFHLFLDFISGRSRPYRRLREGVIIDLGQRLGIRVGQEVAVILLFLWIYLRQ